MEIGSDCMANCIIQALYLNAYPFKATLQHAALKENYWGQFLKKREDVGADMGVKDPNSDHVEDTDRQPALCWV